MSINLQQFFSPGPSDVEYIQDDQLRISLICRIDSYKFSHPFAYPDKVDGEGTIVGAVSYGEARIKDTTVIIPAGMQLLVKRYLTQRITMADIDAAEKFTEAHFGRKLFDRKGWEKVVNVYGGYLPLIIRAVPEGTRLRGGLPIYTVSVFDKDLVWMSAGFETMIQRAVWYPTTVASQDYRTKELLRYFYELTGANMDLLGFALHDFGGRGVSSAESAEIGGAAHTFNFMGSDTVEGVLTANFYYKEQMAAFSVYATEHTIEISFGPNYDDAVNYIRHQLTKARELGVPIVSIVLDGFDVFRETEICCTVLRDDIIEYCKAGGKVVFRPDSGDMMEVVPRILRMQEAAFGVTMTKKNYKSINYVGIIQGDGVDYLAISGLLGKITSVYGYSADCVVFGSGGALLQKLDRDTFKFAQKACAQLIEMPDGSQYWRGVSKNPITDSGKKSKEGVLTTVRSKMTGELMAARLDQGPLNEEFEDLMKLVYSMGRLFNETTLSEVRGRIEA